MYRKACRSVGALWLAVALVLPASAAGQSVASTVEEAASGTDQSAPATEQEVRSLLATLRDPQARAALERQLELLLEAQADAGDGDAKPEQASVTAIVADEIDAIWQQVSEIPVRRWLEGGLATVGAILLAIVVYWLVRKTAAAGAAVLRQTGPKTREAIDAMVGSMGATLRLLLRLVVLLGLIAMLARIWGIPWNRLLPQAIIEGLAEVGFSLLLIGVLTAVAWHAIIAVVRIVFDRLTNRASARKAQRIRTLEPLCVSVGRFAIGTLALMILLAELGLDIGPLLAGAGVIGIAIGLGAQNLVRDVLNGVMIIVDDAASVGDVVEVAGHRGLVESMNLRLMTLRDLSGVVHSVPYGEIKTVMNFTKDFSYALIDVGVAYREDIGEVVDTLQSVGGRFRKDSEMAERTLEDLEILGVDRLADSAVVVRVRMKTRADDRWFVERALRRAIKEGLDEAGIEIPFPHATLYFGRNKDGEAAPANLRMLEE